MYHPYIRCNCLPTQSRWHTIANIKDISPAQHHRNHLNIRMKVCCLFCLCVSDCTKYSLMMIHCRQYTNSYKCHNHLCSFQSSQFYIRMKGKTSLLKKLHKKCSCLQTHRKKCKARRISNSLKH